MHESNLGLHIYRDTSASAVNYTQHDVVYQRPASYRWAPQLKPSALRHPNRSFRASPRARVLASLHSPHCLLCLSSRSATNKVPESLVAITMMPLYHFFTLILFSLSVAASAVDVPDSPDWWQGMFVNISMVSTPCLLPYESCPRERGSEAQWCCDYRGCDWVYRCKPGLR